MLFLSPFLLISGLMQVIAASQGLRGMSLTGHRRKLGYLVGIILFVAGVFLLPSNAWVFAMVLPAAALGLLCLLAAGALTGRDLDPARFLRPGDSPEGNCQAVHIPNRERVIPGLLVTPPDAGEAAICLVHGSGDNKTAFKWRLVRALLWRGLTVLTIDLAGHGENPAPQRWPDCTTEIPAALIWLRARPGAGRVGLLGISMGGALSAHAAVAARPDALALCETPVEFHYTQGMVWREVWHTLRSPVLDLFRETTAWQIWRTWNSEPPGRREVGLAELIRRLDVPGRVTDLACPLHLVYGQRDDIAPTEHSHRLQEAAGGRAQLTNVRGASHLTLILMPETAQTLADWFAQQLAIHDA